MPLDDEDYLVTYSFVKFNNQQIELRFTPATQADKDALAALIPANATSTADLPTFLPNSIQVIPELVLNGTVIQTSGAIGLGNEVEILYQTSNPRKTNNINRYSVVAGSYLNIPIVGYSVNSYKLVDLQKAVSSTKDILDSKDQTAIASLTREDILGNLFYSGGLGYFAQLNTMNEMLGIQGKAVGITMFGYGSYGYEPKIKTAGILALPVGINTGSISTNILTIIQSQGKDDNSDDKLNMGYQMGMNSSILESAISEQLFCNDTVNPPVNGVTPECYGISTVSGLNRAAKAGQRIYQLTSKNINTAQFATSGDDMSNDIAKTINNGRTVLVPEKAVDGVGHSAIYVYALLKADGSSGWKISGGLNGAFLSGFSLGILLAVIATGGLATLGAFALIITLMSVAIAFVLLMTYIVEGFSEGLGWQTVECGAEGMFGGFYLLAGVIEKTLKEEVSKIVKFMYIGSSSMVPVTGFHCVTP